ncbi:hypothetical protein D1871_20195 [Nakamurella silvestris]|nr:hypothetical protein D1871_20195 [Nakamurella silvestris]
MEWTTELSNNSASEASTDVVVSEEAPLAAVTDPEATAAALVSAGSATLQAARLTTTTPVSTAEVTRPRMSGFRPVLPLLFAVTVVLGSTFVLVFTRYRSPGVLVIVCNLE